MVQTPIIMSKQDYHTENYQKKTFSCELCKDTGVIYCKESKTAKICDCQQRKRYLKILSKSGISEEFQKIKLTNFKNYTEEQTKALNTAIDYVKNFENFKETRNNSIAFLGKPGTGKTHLSVAIANNLMSKNIGVLYMSYRDVMTLLKQNIINEEKYSNIINLYKKANVLLIDDFAKGRTTASDINIMFEIINYRYFNCKPIILSSELTPKKLMEFDEAIASRILHMCKDNIVDMTNIKNYRLNK